MKILYCSNTTSNQGGAELNLYKIYNYFSQKNTTYLILPNSDGIFERYINSGHTPIVINSNRPSLRLGVMNFLKVFINLPFTIYRIKKVITSNKIDIVHTNDIIDFPAMIAAKLSNAKLVSHLRFIIKEENVKKKIFRWLYLNCSDHIICVSKAVKDSWFPNNNKATVVYDCGPDLSEFSRKRNKNSFKDKKLNIVAVGKLVNISGHENIIKAISKLDKDIQKNIKMNIVGGSVEGHESYEHYLQGLVNYNNLADIISFIGYTPNVPKYLDAADLFCFTPMWEHSFPNVVLEAMAMDLPVLAYNKGGISEQIDDGINGYLVNTVEELKGKIEEMYYDRDLLKLFSYNSSKVLKKKFLFSKQFEGIEKIYFSLIR